MLVKLHDLCIEIQIVREEWSMKKYLASPWVSPGKGVKFDCWFDHFRKDRSNKVSVGVVIDVGNSNSSFCS